MRIFFIIIGISLFVMSCNLEINTVDPQASIDIYSSKEDSFFIQEYQPALNSDSIFDFSEVWIERCWKYTIIENKKTKMKTDGLQLNFKLSKFNTAYFQPSNYLAGWDMVLRDNGYAGQSNGVFTIFLKQDDIPQNFDIIINKLKKQISSEYSRIRITKK